MDTIASNSPEKLLFCLAHNDLLPQSTRTLWRFKCRLHLILGLFLLLTASVAVKAAEQNKGIAIWANGDDAPPGYAVWDGSEFSLLQSIQKQDATRWQSIKGAASRTRDEVILLGLMPNGKVEVLIYNGKSWKEAAFSPLNDKTTRYWSGHDIEYESKSGNAVLVYHDGIDDKMLYQTWNGSFWSSETRIDSVPANRGSTVDLTLAASPISNEMVLMVGPYRGSDFCIVWNGASWSNGLDLQNEMQGLRNVNVAYEQLSGRAMVVYPRTSNRLHYRIWDGKWSRDESLQPPSGITNRYGIRRIIICGDPTSNRIAVGVASFTINAFWLAVWDGRREWGSVTTATSGSSRDRFRGIAVAFEGNSGKALAVYSLSSKLRYRTWTTGWSSEYSGPDLGDAPNTMNLDASHGSNAIMLSVQDNSRDANFCVWEGNTWRSVHRMTSDTGDTTNTRYPYLFLWKPSLGERRSAPVPSRPPTVLPTSAPTDLPTPSPTQNPSSRPTSATSPEPTPLPSIAPTMPPTSMPTPKPTNRPTSAPSVKLTPSPSANPTKAPAMQLTFNPTSSPTRTRTAAPTEATQIPTIAPTQKVAPIPTMMPTPLPTAFPSKAPTPSPTRGPPSLKDPTPSNSTIPASRQGTTRDTGKFCLSDSDCKSKTCRSGVCMATSECYPIRHEFGSPFDKHRINIVFVASGFDTEDHEVWRANVNRTFGYFEYFKMFDKEIETLNAFIVDPNELDSSFCAHGCYGVDRLLCCDIDRAHDLASKCFPVGSNLQTIVIHNSLAYGGAGYVDQNVATVSIHPKAPLVAIHELGHSLFELGDEYVYGDGTDADPNCCETCDKWADLIGRKNTPRGYPAVQCVPGCKDGEYYIGFNSNMRTLSQGIGAVNARFTCCTYLAITKTMPPFCQAFDFSPGYLLNYCVTNDFQNYGAANYYDDATTRIGGNSMPVDESLIDLSKYLFLRDPVLVKVKLRRNGKAVVRDDPAPLPTGLYRKNKVKGDYVRLRDAAKDGLDSLVKVKIFYNSGKETLLFSKKTRIDVPLPPNDGNTTRNDKPRRIFAQSKVIEIIVDLNGRKLRRVRGQQVDITAN